MNWKLVGLWVVLADFAALSGFAVWQYGYVGIFQAAFANLAATQLFADLVIALSLVMIWMVRDARARGAGVAPYLVTTVLLGSIGPLLYLIARERAAARDAAPVAVAAQRAPA